MRRATLENISSIEVEIALARHPAVLMAAAVARSDEKWVHLGDAEADE